MGRTDHLVDEKLTGIRRGKRRGNEGFVYLIGHKSFPHHVKVGRSKDPWIRLSQANIWCPEKGWEILFYRHFTNPRKAEARIHSLLAEHRKLGEWFSVPPGEAIEILMRL